MPGLNFEMLKFTDHPEPTLINWIIASRKESLRLLFPPIRLLFREVATQAPL